MTRLVPIRDEHGRRVAQVNPETNRLHDAVTGRPLMPGSRKELRALEAMRDYLDSQPHRKLAKESEG